ncbi:uncharacterized protein AB9W97_014909 isoform 2-T2 [Spinachia spinachia]
MARGLFFRGEDVVSMNIKTYNRICGGKKMIVTKQRVFVVILHFIILSVAHRHNRSAEDALEHSGGHAPPGRCSYGHTTSCCLGWRNVNGICQPVCEALCANGKCVGPDKCLCSPGYAGRQCDEGEAACSSLRCQFGCQMERGGAVRCLCPPGLHLAADSKTCEDDDECRRGADVCRPRRTCRNTFGSFVCVCRDGFVMGTLNGAVQCRDEDECLIGSHRCSRRAQCVNTDGSYTCQCLEDYLGNGRTCWPRRASQSKADMYFNYKLSKRTKPRRPFI